MMFPFVHKRRCARRDPRAAALLGLMSAMMIAGGAWLGRYKGEHEWLILAGMICFILIGLGLIRLVMLNPRG